MPIAGTASDTGFAPLPDVGTLSYNGAVFSSLFKTSTSGKAIKDVTGRTTKFTELTITAEGYVTLGDVLESDQTIDSTMASLQSLLTQCGGALVYEGKGLGLLTVNKTGGTLWDVNFGPKPELLEFKPLGGSLSAIIKWTVTTWIPQFTVAAGLGNTGQPPATSPIVQFNEETGVTYDDEGYSSLSIKGTMEVPMTRAAIGTRTLNVTADSYRARFMNQVANAVDLTYFRVTHREFNMSRDKRTMEWSFAAEEIPPMGLPPGATNARGKLSVRPKTSGAGLCSWVCSLSCTYTIAQKQPRRLAWAAFVSLLAFRMQQSINGDIQAITAAIKAGQNPFPGAAPNPQLPAPLNNNVLQFYRNQLNKQQQGFTKGPLANAFLVHFGFDEGMYLDSKTMSFEASWMLITVIDLLLVSTGVWRGSGVEGPQGRILWANSVDNIMGANSWLVNQFDPASEVLIDLGVNP
jgi:hypothetical protein